MSFEKESEIPAAAALVRWWRRPVLLVLLGAAVLATTGWWWQARQAVRRVDSAQAQKGERELEAEIAALSAGLPPVADPRLDDAQLARIDAIADRYRRLGELHPDQPARTEPEVRRWTERAERTRSAQRAARSAALATQAQDRLRAGDRAGAAADLREAWELQRAINLSTVDAGAKSYARETRLAQELAALAAEPLREEAERQLAAARAAVAAGDELAARAAFAGARSAWERLNREYPRSPHADPQALGRIEAESAGWQAATLDRRAEAALTAARAAEAAGEPAAATQQLDQAEAAQRELLEKFSRSPLAARTRLEAIERERQTLGAGELWRGAARQAAEAQQHLARRRILQAVEAVRSARRQLAEAESRWPKARGGDAGLRARLDFLDAHAAELAAWQDRAYARLRPAPQSAGLALGSEPVVQEDFAALLGLNPSRRPAAEAPVDSVTLAEAREFCERLGWILGHPVRLATADEMRAARQAPAGFMGLGDGPPVWLADETAMAEGAPVWAPEGAVRRAPPRERAGVGLRVVVAVDLLHPPGADGSAPEAGR